MLPRSLLLLLTTALLCCPLATGCGDDDGPATGGDADGSVLDTLEVASDGTAGDADDTTSASDTHAADTQTAPDLGAECSAANADGFFPDCSACLDPTNCDVIDAPGASGRACGCAGSGDCPCGFSCGSYEIAPGISISGICVAR